MSTAALVPAGQLFLRRACGQARGVQHGADGVFRVAHGFGDDAQRSVSEPIDALAFRAGRVVVNLKVKAASRVSVPAQVHRVSDSLGNNRRGPIARPANATGSASG